MNTQTSVQKIKVYDIRQTVEETDFGNGKKMTTYSDHKVAIVEGSKGIFIFDDEACGRTFKSKSEEFEIYVKEHTGELISLGFPTGSINPTIEYLVNNVSYEEMTIRDFVRQFGSRLERNFHDALNVLKEIGLNPGEYYTSQEI